MRRDIRAADPIWMWASTSTMGPSTTAVSGMCLEPKAKSRTFVNCRAVTEHSGHGGRAEEGRRHPGAALLAAETRTRLPPDRVQRATAATAVDRIRCELCKPRSAHGRSLVARGPSQVPGYNGRRAPATAVKKRWSQADNSRVTCTSPCTGLAGCGSDIGETKFVSVPSPVVSAAARPQPDCRKHPGGGWPER